jgi:hypothetical protein
MNEDEHLKQIKKDKCTTEQFWAVATILGVNAFLLTQQASFTFAAHWVIIVHSAFISFYAMWFVIDRAKTYREINTGNRGLELSDLKGTGIYIYLIFSSFCAVTVSYAS